MWRSPLQGGGGGRAAIAAPQAANSGETAADAPILSSYLRNNCPERRRFIASSRSSLMRQVEPKTLQFRLRKASEARQKAAEARRAFNFGRARWYDSRAKGQLERFEQVRECGAKELVQSCNNCGHVSRRITAWCRHWRLCVGCRSRRGAYYRRRFRHSREHALHRRAHLMTGSRPGGAWTEKFFTLTLPHSGDMRRDLVTLPKAWRGFWKLTRLHLEHDRRFTKAQIKEVVYVRVIEMTAGRKNDGHAHMHVYLICPYLYLAVVRVHWTKVLTSCGYDVNASRAPTPLAEVLAQEMEEWRRKELQRLLITRRNGEPLEAVPNPSLDIQKCHEGIEQEIIKYFVKDAERDEQGRLVFDEDFLARVYEGTEGIRMLQTSGHFWVPISSNPCTCEKCGCTKFTRQIEPAQPAESDGPVRSLIDLPPEKWRQNE